MKLESVEPADIALEEDPVFSIKDVEIENLSMFNYTEDCNVKSEPVAKTDGHAKMSVSYKKYLYGPKAPETMRPSSALHILSSRETVKA